jgi:hypothetical protein
MASVATYSRIEQETGHTADWRQTGSVRIGCGERRCSWANQAMLNATTVRSALAMTTESTPPE